MDEEADFANILSQSTIQRPTWTTSDPSSDPWANPFSSSSPTNPFASSTSAFGSTSAYVPGLPQLDREDEVSPYVAKLEEDVAFGIGNLPDPPSVIAAREQEATEAEEGFGSYPIQSQDQDAFTVPYSPPRPTEEEVKIGSPTPPSRKLPSDLIDDDLMAESDPSVTLKKAFVKPTPAPRTEAKVEGKKAYVFTPAKKGGEDKKGKTPEAKAVPVKEPSPVKKDTPEKMSSPVQKAKPAEEVNSVEKDEPREKVVEKVDAAPTPSPDTIKSTEESSKEDDKEVKETNEMDVSETAAESTARTTSDTESARLQNSEPILPESIPLPASGQATPSISRIASPVSANKGFLSTNDLFSPNSTPKHDRVAVSPLDPPPPAEKDYGFHHLSIGGSSQAHVAPPPKSSTDWNQPSATSSGSRFAGKGWAAVDEVDDLFGAGGPSVRSDPWGGSGDGEGWAGDNVPTMSGPSQSYNSTSSSPIEATHPLPTESQDDEPPPTPAKRKTPLFQISVGDPTKVGDPVRGYTVYTIRTRTSSPHYRKSEISVLRRFSEFLWLFDALALNNPGVIVPPMPDKQPWGRFQDQFVETRRQALQRCLTKITSHPVLQLDPDLRMFLESDSFAVEAKNRRLEVIPEKTGILANWTGPRYTEQDDWFDSRKNFLDSLESQLKGLSKSIESASKARLELSITMGDYASSMTDLAESDLGSGMCAALARLSDLARQEKEVHEEQAKGDVMTLLNMADEYCRFIGSVRLAFAARIRAFHHWQNMEKEVGKMKYQREKLRQQGRLGDRVNSSLSEINDAERRVRDSSIDFENISKLIKSEFSRFERERVEEFKRILEGQLDIQIQKQKELIDAWEGYHGFVLKMVQKSQGR